MLLRLTQVATTRCITARNKFIHTNIILNCVRYCSTIATLPSSTSSTTASTTVSTIASSTVKSRNPNYKGKKYNENFHRRDRNKPRTSSQSSVSVQDIQNIFTSTDISKIRKDVDQLLIDHKGAIGAVQITLLMKRFTTTNSLVLENATATYIADAIADIPLDAKQLSSATTILSLIKGTDQQSIGIQQLISTLANKLLQVHDVEAKQIALMLNSLKLFKDSSHVKPLLQAVRMKMVESNCVLAPRHLVSALLGLQKMSCTTLEMKKLLQELSSRIMCSNDDFSINMISMAIYSLHNMNTNSSHVKDLLQALYIKCDSSKHTELADPIKLCMALYGLQNMSSDVVQVKDILKVLTSHVAYCNEPFDSQGVCMALFGLQNMSSDVVEVRNLLRELYPKILSCKSELSAQGIGMTLFGLQHMSSSVPEVVNVLSALHPMIVGCTKPANVRCMTMALHGLKCMSNDVPEVLSLIHI